MKNFRNMSAVDKAEYLNEKFIEMDGQLYWRELDHHSKGFGALGNNNGGGYLQVRVDNKNLYAHRIIFAIHSGYWPEHDIDHVDGVRDNNQIDNLQEASASCNASKACWALGTSGVRGIHPNKKSWQAHMSFNYKQVVAKARPTRGMALLDWVDMIHEKLSAESCLAPQLQVNIKLAKRYVRIFGDHRDGAWDSTKRLS